MENSEYMADIPFLDMLLKCNYKQYHAIKEVSNHTLVFYNCDNFIDLEIITTHPIPNNK